MRISCTKTWCTIRGMASKNPENKDTLNVLGMPMALTAVSEPQEVIPNIDEVLMSDVLHGQVPEFDDEAEALAENYVIVVFNVIYNNQLEPFTGTLTSIACLDNCSIEIESRVELESAMKVLKSTKRCVEQLTVSFDEIELHQGENELVRLEGPFDLGGCRILDVDYQRNMCSLLLQLL